MKNFWQDLPRPFTLLAPLDGVTDVVFRQMIIKLGKPDVLFTEFTSTDGLQSLGARSVSDRLLFHPNEQPLVAQIWGTNPEKFYKSAKEIQEMGFAGIDINTGCPDKTVIKMGACSALIKNPKLAGEIIQAVKEGAPHLPVSVKTRIGFYEESIGEWIPFLLQQNLAALTVHLRTVKELSEVPAHWELMPNIVKIRNEISPHTILVGNGDITHLSEVLEKHKQYHCDGFMIGRGIFYNPWVFNKDINSKTISKQQRFQTYLKHIELFQNQWGNSKSFFPLKKYCKAYIQQFDGASDARVKIMETKTLEELKKIVEELAKN
jgi:tRNA-dihydrouridine synthase